MMTDPQPTANPNSRHGPIFPRARDTTAGSNSHRRDHGKHQRDVFRPVAKEIGAVRQKDIRRKPARLNKRKQFDPHPAGCDTTECSRDSTAGCMLLSQFLRLAPDFDQVLQDGIIAVPLHKIRAAHEGAVFGGAPVVVPEVEIVELDRLLKGVAWSGSPSWRSPSMMALPERIFSFVDCTTASASR